MTVRIGELKSVLDRLGIKEIGIGDIFPGTPAANMQRNKVVGYSGRAGYGVLSEVRDRQGLSRLHVLTSSGASLTVYPIAKEIEVLPGLSEEQLEELRKSAGESGYYVSFPKDKGDSL
jgi:hypothetical protein